MASYSEPRLKTHEAAADLSSYQYRFAKFSGTGTTTVTYSGLNGRTIGVIQNSDADAAGKAVSVAKSGGGSKLELGGTVGAGQKITSDASGKGVVVDAAGEWTGAIAEQNGVDGDVIDVTVTGFESHSSGA